MTTPEKGAVVTTSDKNLPQKSKIPVLPKNSRSLLTAKKPTPSLPSTSEHSIQRPIATELPKQPVPNQLTGTNTTSKSQIRKSRQVPATQSLTIGRSVSASQIEIPRVRGKQSVLSYSKLSQENKQLHTEVSALRTSLLEVRCGREEERSSLSSEIEQLSTLLAESNSSVDELSEQSTQERERVNQLISVMEGVGIDPVSGEEVLSENERRQVRLTAVEKTRVLTDSLNRQISRFEEMCAELEEKRQEMLLLPSLEDQGLTPTEDDLCVVSLSDHSLDTSTTVHVITEKPLPL